MPNLDRRIVLWRKTIGLFFEYKSLKYVGPLKKAGFHIVQIEAYFDLKKPGETNDKPGEKPDIVASSQNDWMVLELTLNDESKGCQLDAYKTLDGRMLEIFGETPIQKSPQVICCRLSDWEDGKYCQIIFNDAISIKNPETIENDNVRKALDDINGVKLKFEPDIPFTLVPESKNSEIRRGITSQIMRLLTPDFSYTVDQIVREGLDIIDEHISDVVRENLVNKVQMELDDLVSGRLKDYIVYSDGVYRLKDGVKDHHSLRNKVAEILEDWAKSRTYPTLDDF